MSLNQISIDDLLSDSFSNSIVAMSSVSALREVLLVTAEQKKLYNSKQKKLYNSKQKKYIKKFFLEYVDKYHIKNREQLLEKLLK